MSDDSGNFVDGTQNNVNIRTTSYYYDIGYDMLVMQNEMGCPYSKGVCTVNGVDNQDCVLKLAIVAVVIKFIRLHFAS